MSGLKLHQAGIEVDGRWLVRGATLEVRAGSLTALVGPNGSGKTTLLRLLAGLWPPSEGQATLDGRDLQFISRRHLAQRIAFVPQDTHLSFEFTVREVVAMGRHPHLGRFERERKIDRDCVEAAMRRADLTHLADRLVTELSGGERQRVILARCLATGAGVMLLDEPTSSLDIAHTLDVLDLCRSLTDEGQTVAMALHDLNAAMRYAHQVTLIHDGLLVGSGSPTEVITATTVKTVFGVRAERALTGNGESLWLFTRGDEARDRGRHQLHT